MPPRIPVIQWEKESAEAAGLVKIDLLGNPSLGVIRDGIASIRDTQGGFTDFHEIDPENDPARVIFGTWSSIPASSAPRPMNLSTRTLNACTQVYGSPLTL